MCPSLQGSSLFALGSTRTPLPSRRLSSLFSDQVRGPFMCSLPYHLSSKPGKNSVKCSFDLHFTDKKTESRETKFLIKTITQSQDPNSYQMIPNPIFWLQVTEQKTSLPLTLRLQLLNIKKVGRRAIVSIDSGQERECIWVIKTRVHWALTCSKPLAECWVCSLISFSRVVRYKCDQYCALHFITRETEAQGC